MNTYHKIVTLYKRDPATKYKTLLEGHYALPEFYYLENCSWVWTEKLHGTNIRVIIDNNKIEYRGKTDRAEMLPGMVERLHELFRIQNVFLLHQLFPEGQTCLYGEGVGAGINKGGGYSSGEDFVLFDVKCGHWWLKREDVENIADRLNLRIAPIVGVGTLPQLVKQVRAGFNSRWGDFTAEGIVARPEIELENRAGNRVITKLKHSDFEQLKQGE